MLVVVSLQVWMRDTFMIHEPGPLSSACLRCVGAPNCSCAAPQLLLPPLARQQQAQQVAGAPKLLGSRSITVTLITAGAAEVFQLRSTAVVLAGEAWDAGRALMGLPAGAEDQEQS